MRIGVDIDDTIYDFDGAARDVLILVNSLGNRSMLPEALDEEQTMALKNGANYHQWDGIEKIVGPANWSWLWDHVNEFNLFQRGYPLPGSLEALKVLAASHEVWLITARPQQWSHQTFTWLDQWKVNAAAVVHGPSKWEVASALDFRVVVDDGPKNLKGYLKRSSGSMKGAYIYGIRRYEPVQSTYARFRYVDGLADVVADQERWTS